MITFKVEWMDSDTDRVKITRTDNPHGKQWIYSYFITGRSGWTVDMVIVEIQGEVSNMDRQQLSELLNVKRAEYRLTRQRKGV